MTPYLPAHAPSPRPHHPLDRDITCDVCVIGGGICGVLTAHLLNERGLSVVLLEAGRLLCGQTRGTTAKLTAQHGLFADRLIRAVGLSHAQSYAQANLRALGAFKRSSKLQVSTALTPCKTRISTPSRIRMRWKKSFSLTRSSDCPANWSRIFPFLWMRVPHCA